MKITYSPNIANDIFGRNPLRLLASNTITLGATGSVGTDNYTVPPNRRALINSIIVIHNIQVADTGFMIHVPQAAVTDGVGTVYLLLEQSKLNVVGGVIEHNIVCNAMLNEGEIFALSSQVTMLNSNGTVNIFVGYSGIEFDI